VQFVNRHILRHKLFYIIICVVVFGAIYLFKTTWMINGWIKYCNSVQLKLSNFNSVFELSATFSLAYTVILRFRDSVKTRVYGSVQRRLLVAQSKAEAILIRVPRYNKHILNLTEYINDIVLRQKREDDYLENNLEHRGEGSFLYFGFYSLMCLLISGLIDGDVGYNSNVIAFVFLTLFSFASIVFVEFKYSLASKSHFEFTIVSYIVIVTVCFALARLISSYVITGYSLDFSFLEFLFTSKDKFHASINYCIIFLLAMNLYPYFQIFRSLYFVSMQYSCTSYQINLVVESKMQSKRLANGFWKSLRDFGKVIVDVSDGQIEKDNNYNR
jgi:hypothetical protein